MSQYTILNFVEDYKTDDDCLFEIFKKKYGYLEDFDKYYKVTGKRAYAHSKTGKHIFPLTGTIFYKSATPLRLWFFAIYLFTSSKNGVSAKELQRQLGVTYKCAWRIANKVRTLFDDGSVQDDLDKPDNQDNKPKNPNKLSGYVEADETYLGGRFRGGKRGRSIQNKRVVLGLVERDGRARIKLTDNAKYKTIDKFVSDNCQTDKSGLISDTWKAYKKVGDRFDEHKKINHKDKEYVREEIVDVGLCKLVFKVHTNTIEGLWSIIKNGIRGTYRSSSHRWLKYYVSEFVWRYNRRFETRSFFKMLMERV